MRPSGASSLTAYRRYWRWIASSAVLLVGIIFLVEQSELLGLSSRPTPGWASEIRKGHGAAQVPEQETVLPKPRGRVLITGGGGNIGKHLIRRLLDAQTPITVLDVIFFENELDNIRHQYPRADLKVVIGDIRDQHALSSALTSDVVGVIHLAAVSRVLWCLENERDCEDVNVRGTEAVLSALKGGWFIQASSREVYGDARTFPVVEEAELKPANAYGGTKARAEDAILKIVQRRSTNPLHAIMLRFSNVYGGPADHRERLIPSIMTNALSHRPIQIVGGDQDLDMVHIDDVIDAFALAVNRLEEKRNSKQAESEVEVYNIGTSSSTPAVELIRKILALTNSSSPVQTIPADGRFPDRYVGSTIKSAEVLGYRSRVTMDEGLHRLVIAYLDETVNYLAGQLDADCGVPTRYSDADLLKLDGCTGTIGVDGPENLEYLYQKDGEGSAPPTWEWRDDDEPQTWQFTVQSGPIIRLSREDAKGREGFFEVPEEGRLLGSQSRFGARVDPETGYISLSYLSKSPYTPQHLKGTSFGQRFRITPFCCPGKPTPWPFYREDPLASAINDQRLETYRLFNASQVNTRCQRLEQALHVADDKLARLEEYTTPITLDVAPLPTGVPADWRFRSLNFCTNLCDHPTICVDTGNCACSQSSCTPRARFPFGRFANLPDLSYPPTKIDWNSISGHDPDVLVDQVAKSSWLNVLRPSARRYLSRDPEFPAINLTRIPDEDQKHRDENPDEYDRLQTAWHGCFSADSVMERGVKLLSDVYKPGSLVFMPYYPMTRNFPPVEEWASNALEYFIPPEFDTANMIVPFTFDWGVCNTVLHSLYRVRDWSSPPQVLARISSWQPMGDLNSPCYRIDQDIVIPARTCLHDLLRTTYGDMRKVKPSRQRSILVSFKGSLNGAGSSVRQKITCERPYRGIKGKLSGADGLDRYWNAMKPGADYLETIGDTVFCPLPRGTTGWATRMIDVIYAGCIPILIGDQTHHPFWSLLDYTKFSITVLDIELDHLESILLSYTWEDIQRMQTNLMLIREAYLYPSEGYMEDNLNKGTPFWFALHETEMLRMTRYPV